MFGECPLDDRFIPCLFSFSNFHQKHVWRFSKSEVINEIRWRVAMGPSNLEIYITGPQISTRPKSSILGLTSGWWWRISTGKSRSRENSRAVEGGVPAHSVWAKTLALCGKQWSSSLASVCDCLFTINFHELSYVERVTILCSLMVSWHLD